MLFFFVVLCCWLDLFLFVVLRWFELVLSLFLVLLFFKILGCCSGGLLLLLLLTMIAFVLCHVFVVRHRFLRSLFLFLVLVLVLSFSVVHIIVNIIICQLFCILFLYVVICFWLGFDLHYCSCHFVQCVCLLCSIRVLCSSRSFVHEFVVALVILCWFWFVIWCWLMLLLIDSLLSMLFSLLYFVVY